MEVEVDSHHVTWGTSGVVGQLWVEVLSDPIKGKGASYLVLGQGTSTKIPIYQRQGVHAGP